MKAIQYIPAVVMLAFTLTWMPNAQAGTVDYKQSKYDELRKVRQNYTKQHGKQYARHVHSHQNRAHAHPHANRHKNHRRGYGNHMGYRSPRHGYYYPAHPYRYQRHRRNRNHAFVRPHFHAGINQPCFDRFHNHGLSWGLNFNNRGWGAGIHFD